MAAGSTTTWPATALMELQDDEAELKITLEQGSWVASLMAAGAIPGALLAGYIAQHWGRRIALLSLSALSIIPWIAIGVANRIALLYAARFLAGLATGGACVCVPMYIVEISSKENRGILGSFFQLFLTSGMLLTLLTSIFLTYKPQAIALASVSLVFLGCFYFCPESPIYLMRKGHGIQAERILIKLHGKEKAAFILQDSASVANSARAKSSLSQLMQDRSFIMALVAALGITISSQLSGISLVISYSEKIFEVAGSTVERKTSAVIIMGVQFIAAFLQVFIVRRVGSKKLLLQNCVIALLTLSALGIHSILQDSEDYNLSNFTWLPLASLILYIISYVWGLGPLSWMMLGEFFTSEAKEKAFSAAVVLNWTLNFAATKSFPLLLSAIGIGPTFLIFAGFMIAAMLHVIFFVPETKGKTLKQIQDELYGFKLQHRTKIVADC